MTTVAATPPAESHAGTTAGQCWYAAYPVVTAMPSRTPPTPPSAASNNDSTRNCSRICPRVAPSDRRSPISVRRSSTEMTIVLATPTTLNHCPPNHTRTDRSAVARPSRRAALAPRTTAGYRAVAALSQAPLTTLAPTVPSRSVRAARTPMPPVSPDWIRSVRYTWTSGRCESLAEQRLARADPQQVRAEPGELAVEVGVAGGGDADDRHHRGDADRDAQRGQHHPQGARAQPGRPHPGDVAGAQPRRSRYPARVHATTFPSRISTRRGRLAAMSRSWVMTTTVVPAACSSRSRSSTPVPDAESRLPVGSSATARAIATRCFSPPESWCGRWVSRCARPTRHSAATARRRRSRTRTPAYSRPSA